MGKKKLKRKIANLEDDMSSLLIENEKLRNNRKYYFRNAIIREILLGS